MFHLLLCSRLYLKYF